MSRTRCDDSALAVVLSVGSLLQLLFAGGFWLVHQLAYWGINGVLYLIYHFNLLARYKIQAADKWPDRKLVIKCLTERAASTLLIQPVAMWFLYRPFVKYGLDVSAECSVQLAGCGLTSGVVLCARVQIHTPVPSAWTFLWQTCAFFVINDALFYWAHRLLHHPKLYGRIHKQHHEFKQSIGIAAEYAHPGKLAVLGVLCSLAAMLLTVFACR